MWSTIQNRANRTRSAGSIVIALASGLFITGVAAPAFADHSDRHTARQDRVAQGETNRRVDRNDGRRADRQMSRRTDEERRQWRGQKRHEQKNWVANNHQRRADRRTDRWEDRVGNRRDHRDARRDRRHDRYDARRDRRHDRKDARRDRRRDHANNRWFGNSPRGYGYDNRRTPERGYIRRGVDRGYFSRREAKRLRHSQRRIDRLEQHFLADGRLSHRERRRLAHAQQEQSDLARLLRHNNRR